MGKIRVGVLGCGHISDHRHIPVFKKLDNVEVVAICDLNEELAKKTAEKFAVKKFYKTLPEMLKENLDVVDILTPPKTHTALSKTVLEAGCHVLVEKPIAMTVSEVDEIYTEAKSRGRTICVVHQNLFNPAVMKAHEMVNKGEVGEILNVEVGTLVRNTNYMCTNAQHWCHKLPGGIFFELLPHPVYLLQLFLTNTKTVGVVAEHRGKYDWIKADEMKAFLKADKGIGTVVSSCNSPYHGDYLNIFGTKMSLQVDLWGRSVFESKERTEDPTSVGKANLRTAAQSIGLLGTTLSNAATAIFQGVKVSAHYGFLKTYIDSIENGRDVPVSADDARNNTRIVSEICGKVDEYIGAQPGPDAK